MMMMMKIMKMMKTHCITVEGVEDSRHVAAQDANGDACIVQSQPAPARLLRAVARKQMIPHRTQHTHLGRGKRFIRLKVYTVEAKWKY